LSNTRYWILTLIAGAAFLAMLVNVALGVTNSNARADVTQRQQFVQQSVQLETLYKEIVRTLAELGARNNDGDVKALLQKHGITYNVNPPAAAPVAAPARK
jgi:hypothetical protein